MKYRNAAILVVVFLIGLSASYFILLPRDTSLTHLQENKRIRIGYAIEAPYAYISTDGTVTGESIEVAKVIVEALGIDHIKWIETNFDTLIAGLLEDRFDVIAAGMFIQPERAKKVQFSNPTFHVKPGLLVPVGNPLQLHSYEDIASKGATVAVLYGSVEETLLRDAGVAESHLVLVPDALTGETALRTGLVDGLALSSPTVQWIATNDPTYTTEAIVITKVSTLDPNWGYGAFAFRPTDDQLIEAWNRELSAYIGSPNHLNLITPFGFTEAELPGAVTTSMVLDDEQ